MSTAPPVVLMWTSLPAHVQAVREALAGRTGFELVVAGSAAEAVERMPGADALLVSSNAAVYTAEIARAASAAPRLRWVQALITGLDGLEDNGVPANAAVTGIGGAFAPLVAEHAMALLLGLSRRVGECAQAQLKGEWNRALGARMCSLEGKVLCLVGVGNIGCAIAERARAFGMRCIGVNSSGHNPAPALIDAVYPVARLNEALALSDAMAISVPANAATRGLFGADQWAACKPGALMVNVGRGAVVQTGPLMDALRSGQLGGAGLDVTEPEPLPPDHPLWTCPGALIIPHLGGAGSLLPLQRVAALVAQNLDRFMAGQPLLNLLEQLPRR